MAIGTRIEGKTTMNIVEAIGVRWTILMGTNLNLKK